MSSSTKNTTKKVFSFPLSESAFVRDPSQDKLKSSRQPNEFKKTKETFDSSLFSQLSAQIQPNSPKKTPGQYQDPNFIFLNRKKVVDFLVTDHIVKNSSTYKKTLETPSPPKDQIDEARFFARKGTIDSPREKMFQSMYPDAISPTSPTKIPEIRTTGGPSDAKVYVDLLTASNAHATLMKFNPLSARSILNDKGEPTNRMIETIKNLHHRMFGMDHINLKRINFLLRTKFEPPKIGPALPVLPSKTEIAHRTLQMTKRGSQGSIPSLHKMVDWKEDEEVPVPVQDDNYNIYEYNALTDDFQFRDVNYNEFGTVLKSLGVGKSHQNSTRNLGSRRKLKLLTEHVQPVGNGFAEKSREEIIKNLQQYAAQKLPKIQTKKTLDLSGGRKVKDFLSARKSYVPVKEESIEEQSKRIFESASRIQMEKSLVREGKEETYKSLDTSSGLQKIENLCQKLGKQNKRMMKNFNKNKKQIRKDYNKLNKQAHAIQDKWIKEEARVK